MGIKADGGGNLTFTTIGDQPPVGLTGSGLLDLVYELCQAGVVQSTGRLVADHSNFGHLVSQGAEGVRRFLLADKRAGHAREEACDANTPAVPLYLTQRDMRELQMAKAAIRAAMEILLAQLGLEASDLQRVILTGSFGSQLNIRAVLGLGMIPAVEPAVVETSANGAGLGAALFLDEKEFERGERIAATAEQIDLDLDPDFNRRYVEAMHLQAM